MIKYYLSINGDHKPIEIDKLTIQCVDTDTKDPGVLFTTKSSLIRALEDVTDELFKSI